LAGGSFANLTFRQEEGGKVLWNNGGEEGSLSFFVMGKTKTM
jgi:hypothetical protein